MPLSFSFPRGKIPQEQEKMMAQEVYVAAVATTPISGFQRSPSSLTAGGFGVHAVKGICSVLSFPFEFSILTLVWRLSKRSSGSLIPALSCMYLHISNSDIYFRRSSITYKEYLSPLTRHFAKRNELAKSLANVRNQPPRGPVSGAPLVGCRDAIRFPSPPVRINCTLSTKTFALLHHHHLPRQLRKEEMAAQSKEILSPWGNALAGALGAVFANTCVYPLDM